MIENARELLLQPGQFYHDRTADRLLYLPRPEEQGRATRLTAYVPGLVTLARVDGTRDTARARLNVSKNTTRREQHGQHFERCARRCERCGGSQPPLPDAAASADAFGEPESAFDDENADGCASSVVAYGVQTIIKLINTIIVTIGNKTSLIHTEQCNHITFSTHAWPLAQLQPPGPLQFTPT